MFLIWSWVLFKGILNLMLPLLYLSYLGSNIRIISIDWSQDPILPVASAIRKMVILAWGGNVLQLIWFNLCLDPFFKENQNLTREIWNFYCGSIYGHIRDVYWKRVKWPPLIWMVQLSPRPIFWGELEFQDRIFIAGLQPVIQPKQFRGPRRGSGVLLQMGCLYIIWCGF
jgi:hypothetical protein